MSSDNRKDAIFSIQVDGIDYGRGLAMFAGNREQYLLIVKSFAEEGRELIQRMCRELEERDFEQYGLSAHTLKGISANIGADGFSQQAKALELAGKNGQSDYIYEHHKEMLDAFETMAEGMDRLLAAELAEDKKEIEGEKQEISKEALLEKLRQAYECLEGFYRENAKEILKECRFYKLKEKEDIGICLKEIEKMIEQFQYEEPMNAISELMAELQKQG